MVESPRTGPARDEIHRHLSSFAARPDIPGAARAPRLPQAREIQLCRLLSIKTGGCPKDCASVQQERHYRTGASRAKS